MKKFLFLFLVPAAIAAAGQLSEFSCQRPKPYNAGSWQNVSLAASAVNGLLVQPGETFSFLKSLNPVQGEFTLGHSLYAGRVVSSRGGGYCQVSTALYNAVLLAGLPVSERYNHSFYDSQDSYVEPGRDAAVSGSGGADFRFENSSSVPLRFEVSAQDGKVTAKLWGDLKAHKRWISTTATRIPHSSLSRRSELAPGTLLRPGFDGWDVSRTLNDLDAQGNTESRRLRDDHYDMIPELVAAP